MHHLTTFSLNTVLPRPFMMMPDPNKLFSPSWILAWSRLTQHRVFEAYLILLSGAALQFWNLLYFIKIIEFVNFRIFVVVPSIITFLLFFYWSDGWRIRHNCIIPCSCYRIWPVVFLWNSRYSWKDFTLFYFCWAFLFWYFAILIPVWCHF